MKLFDDKLAAKVENPVQSIGIEAFFYNVPTDHIPLQ